jgi:hypothetical protein
MMVLYCWDADPGVPPHPGFSFVGRQRQRYAVGIRGRAAAGSATASVLRTASGALRIPHAFGFGGRRSLYRLSALLHSIAIPQKIPCCPFRSITDYLQSHAWRQYAT